MNSNGYNSKRYTVNGNGDWDSDERPDSKSKNKKVNLSLANELKSIIKDRMVVSEYLASSKDILLKDGSSYVELRDPQIVDGIHHNAYLFLYILFKKHFKVSKITVPDEYRGKFDTSFYIPYPSRNIYIKRFDKNNIVVAILSNPGTDEGNESTNIAYKSFSMRLLFVGPNCIDWKGRSFNKAEEVGAMIGRAYRRANEDNYAYIFIENNGNGFYRISVKAKPMNNVIMHNKEILLKSIVDFANNRKNYDKFNIPYRMGILLYGLPGTGKTSFAYAIQNFLKSSGIYTEGCMTTSIGKKTIFNFANNHGQHDATNSDFSFRIILIEEIDELLQNNNRININAEDSTPNIGVNITRKDVLNYIDSTDNALIIATTNHIDAIDSSIIRPGRFDIKFEMKYFDRDLAEQMCDSYSLGKEIKNNILNSIEYPVCPAQLQFNILQYIYANVGKEQ